MLNLLSTGLGQRWVIVTLCPTLAAGCSQGPASIMQEQVTETDVITYEEACDGEGGAGILVDFDRDWNAVMRLLPSSTRSVWAAPDGYIASNQPDELTNESVVAKFRLDEGRVILCD